MARNILNTFLDKLLGFPLWVKQIIYLRLYKNLTLALSEDFIHIPEEDLFHTHIPTLSYLGRTELTDRRNGCEPNIYTFLAGANEGLSMLEISMNNFWTVEEVAKCYIFCLEGNYIKSPERPYIPAMAGFMAGKYRTGEYFKRVGKIDVDQLEKAIVKQKELNEHGAPSKIGEIMISLGYITEKDTSSLLVIKEEAQKRFILDASIIPKEANVPMIDDTQYKAEIARLTEQNIKLREQLNKVLVFLKKNG